MNMKNKTLLFDLETSPNISYTWFGKHEIDVIEFIEEGYILSFAYKWLNQKKTYSYSLADFKGNKEKLVKKLHELFNEADFIIGHNCVEENTPVLTTDLKWIPAGKLKKGDKIVGFEENSIQKNQARQIKESTVEYNKIEERDCYRVILDNGEEIITTPDHKWLKLAPKGRDYRWCETRNLKIGQRVEKFITPWEENKSYESGWLSGFISGEGTLKTHNKIPSSIDFCQRPGGTLNQAIDYCKKIGINISKLKEKIGGIGRGDTLYAYTLGGKWEVFRILGELQVKRLINKINWNNCGLLKGQHTETNTIIGIEFVGKRNVAVMQTSTKTFIASGYAMHNCKQFDIKWANRAFIKYELKPPSPYKVIDTLTMARSYFKFNSNRLNDLGQFLGVGSKLETGGFDLWKRCMLGDKKAFKKMCQYNRQDVVLLEKVYLKLRPYMHNHPVISTQNSFICPICGSSHLQSRGFIQLSGGVFRKRRYQCQECGKWCSGEQERVKDKSNNLKCI